MSGTFPAPFANLEPFARPWIDLPDMEARYGARQDIDLANLQALYAAIAPRLRAIMAHLDGFGNAALPPEEARLYRLAMGLIEAAQAVEFFGSARLPDAPYPHHVTVGGSAG